MTSVLANLSLILVFIFMMWGRTRLMVIYVYDYVRGVFEALSWVQRLLVNSVDPEMDPLDVLNRAVAEVENAIEDIKEGVAMDFRERLRRNYDVNGSS